jgi:hypothetical protein
LTAQGFAFDRWSTPASYFFYVITGLHAAHLMLGVLALLLCLCALGWFKRVEYRQVAVDSTAWFWHTMSVAWLVLLAFWRSVNDMSPPRCTYSSVKYSIAWPRISNACPAWGVMRRRRLECTRALLVACVETRIEKSVVADVAMLSILTQFFGHFRLRFR